MKQDHVRADDLDWQSVGTGGTDYQGRFKQLGRSAGGERLGCTLVELPAGSSSWPFHYHLGNEEAIYVLAGEGTLRLGEGSVQLRAGSYVALRVGEVGVHKVTNTSSAPLQYLCVSTMQEPDITVYPDSDKVGLFAGSAPGGDEEQRTLRAFLDRGAERGYWEGE